MLDRPLLDVLAVAGVVLGVLALAYAFLVQARVRAMRRQLAGFLALPAVRDRQHTVQHIAVIRYDAFPDAGGRLSHSVAILDGSGDGVVLTTITGRSDTRSYAKAVRAGVGVDPTSPEEQEAIAEALATVGPAPDAIDGTRSATAGATDPAVGERSDRPGTRESKGGAAA